ncbi:hypothetical protein BLOT_001304 [Blomia tropicalis]|nr:hypothetical protein BLOT_001304 [Blomia tropicalis]
MNMPQLNYSSIDCDDNVNEYMLDTFYNDTNNWHDKLNNDHLIRSNNISKIGKLNTHIQLLKHLSRMSDLTKEDHSFLEYWAKVEEKLEQEKQNNILAMAHKSTTIPYNNLLPFSNSQLSTSYLVNKSPFPRLLSVIHGIKHNSVMIPEIRTIFDSIQKVQSKSDFESLNSFQCKGSNSVYYDYQIDFPPEATSSGYSVNNTTSQEYLNNPVLSNTYMHSSVIENKTLNSPISNNVMSPQLYDPEELIPKPILEFDFSPLKSNLNGSSTTFESLETCKYKTNSKKCLTEFDNTFKRKEYKKISLKNDIKLLSEMSYEQPNSINRSMKTTKDHRKYANEKHLTFSLSSNNKPDMSATMINSSLTSNISPSSSFNKSEICNSSSEESVFDKGPNINQRKRRQSKLLTKSDEQRQVRLTKLRETNQRNQQNVLQEHPTIVKRNY